ncbi:MAG: hemolysin family protein [Actinomycetota bacterium]
MSTLLSVLAVIALIGANAFFVADEFALVAVDRSQVNLRAADGQRPWPTVQKLLRELSFHLSAAQVGITISSLIVGFIAAPVGRAILAPLLDRIFGEGNTDWLIVPLAFILANMLQVVMGEVVPKTVAIAEPIRVLRILARGIAVWGFIVRPVVSVINDMADWIVARMGMEPGDELAGITSMTELEHVIRASGEEGTLDPEDVTRLTRTIRFAEKTAGDILVPRVDLDVLGKEDTLADLCRVADDTGHSRFPVIGTDTDDVLGLVHVKAALGVPPAERTAISVERHMNDAFVVPETRELDTLLGEMYRDGYHLAFVLDEHGGVAGIVTIEDIVEEIVGEIDDEYDRQSVDDVQELDDTTVVVNGAIHPDELEEATGIVLPEGDFETVAGFALDQLQRIPDEGDSFDWQGFQFLVLEMERWRIEKLRIVAPEPLRRTEAEAEVAE